jgi:hypothetical protein
MLALQMDVPTNVNLKERSASTQWSFNEEVKDRIYTKLQVMDL